MDKVLYLLRHAKSDWDNVLADIERPLAPRGCKAAAAMARHLTSAGIVPGLILCSPARRTRQTLELISQAFEVEPEVQFEQWIYGASAARLLANLRDLPASAGSVMLIGHNPGMEELAAILAAPGAELERLQQKFPTGALAILKVPGWGELEAGSAELVKFVAPRELT